MSETANKAADAVVVLKLNIRKPGMTKRVGSGEVRVRARGVEDSEAQDADESALKVSKIILEAPEYAEIQAHDRSMRAYVRSQALPTRLDNARTLHPLSLMERIDTKIQAMTEAREKLVEAFIAVYPAKQEEAKARLGDLYNEKDYPSAQALKEAFVVDSSISTLEMPGAGLARTSQALYARELKKVEAAREKMVAEIQEGLRLGMAELVGDLVNRLDPQDGTQPQVRADQVEKLQSFVRDFSSLNIAGDEQLQGLVKVAGDLITGTKVNTLRASTSAREVLAKGLREVREKLGDMISSDSSVLRGAALELSEPAKRSAPEVETSVRAGLLESFADDSSKAQAPSTTVDVVAQVEEVTADEVLPTLDQLLQKQPTQTPRGRYLDESARRAMAERELERLQKRAEGKARRAKEEAEKNAPKVRRVELEESAPRAPEEIQPNQRIAAIDW